MYTDDKQETKANEVRTRDSAAPRRGRSKLSEILNLRVPVEYRQAIRKAARETGRSEGAIMREILGCPLPCDGSF